MVLPSGMPSFSNAAHASKLSRLLAGVHRRLNHESHRQLHDSVSPNRRGMAQASPDRSFPTPVRPKRKSGRVASGKSRSCLDRVAVSEGCLAGGGDAAGAPRFIDEVMAALLPTNGKPRPAPAAAGAPEQDEPFTGTWTAFVRTGQGDVPVSLTARGPNDIHAKLGSQYETLVNQARFRGGRLTGVMTGDLGVGGQLQ